MTVVLPKTKDKAKGQLNAGISAATTSIPLKSGEGTNFPQPYSGTCSSAGDNVTLNDTGDLGNLAVGDFVRNVTDGSWAFVTVAGTNSVTTTQLRGGSDNTWDNGDEWRVNEFVVTLAQITSGEDTAYEEVLIKGRSTDTLTADASGRGYNGTTAQAFDADDYVQLRVTSPVVEEFKELVKEAKEQMDAATTAIAANETDIETKVSNLNVGLPYYATTTGSANAYVLTASPALGAYAAGNMFHFKSNFANTGACTLNVSGLGAKDIKKMIASGVSDLASGDIQNGQMVDVRYDGTQFQMTSPLGQVQTVSWSAKAGAYASSTEQTNPTSMTAFDAGGYTIPANELIAGVMYDFEASGEFIVNAGTLVTLYVMAGTTALATLRCVVASTSSVTKNYWHIKGFLIGTTTAGASAAVRASALANVRQTGTDNNADSPAQYTTNNLATNGTLLLQFGIAFGTSDANNKATLHMSKIAKVVVA